MVINPPDDAVITRHPLAVAIVTSVTVHSESTCRPTSTATAHATVCRSDLGPGTRVCRAKRAPGSAQMLSRPRRQRARGLIRTNAAAQTAYPFRTSRGARSNPAPRTTCERTSESRAELSHDINRKRPARLPNDRSEITAARPARSQRRRHDGRVSCCPPASCCTAGAASRSSGRRGLIMRWPSWTGKSEPTDGSVGRVTGRVVVGRGRRVTALRAR